MRYTIIALGWRVRIKDGSRTIVDGPFTIQVKSRVSGEERQQ